MERYSEPNTQKIKLSALKLYIFIDLDLEIRKFSLLKKTILVINGRYILGRPTHENNEIKPHRTCSLIFYL